MHISAQRNQIISWLVRKVQPEKNCYLASCSVGALQQTKDTKNARHVLHMCEASRVVSNRIKTTKSMSATIGLRKNKQAIPLENSDPGLDDTTYVQHVRKT